MIKKLRLKFILINMSIVTVMLLAIFGLIFYFTSANLEMQSIRMMQNIAIQALRPNEKPARKDEIRLPFFAIQVGPGGEAVTIVGEHHALEENGAAEMLAKKALESPKQFGVIPEYALRYYRMEAPSRHYLVFTDISSELDTLEKLHHICLLIGGISFLVFLWVSVLLSKWAVRPVEQAWRQQREFVAAASHELKTPLAVIMTNAQMLASSDYDETKRTRFLGNILTMSQQMKHLVEQMLEQARTDNAQPTTITEKVVFSKLVSNAMLPFEPIFFEKGLTLSAQIEEDLVVVGSEEQLRQVVGILLDNAQKYSIAGGATTVLLTRCKKDRCRLIVQNQGENISQEALTNIFKRFYRIDSARSRTGSFGLGLSIAKNIVEQHKGKIWAKSQDGLNEFFVELPCGLPNK